MGEPKVEVTCPLSFLLISILGHIMFLIRPSTTVFINHLCLYSYPSISSNTVDLLSSSIIPAVSTDY